jgi:phosphoenolpyruvate carboxylase
LQTFLSLFPRLVSDRITEKLVFGLVEKEYLLSVNQLLMVSQKSRLLEDNQDLEMSIDARRKYLDPLNHIQVSPHSDRPFKTMHGWFLSRSTL